MKKKSKYSVWIRNVSQKSISLKDLNLTIPSLASLDLMKLNYPINQIQKSIDSGSIFKNLKNLIITENVPKNVMIEPKIISENCFKSLPKSVIDEDETLKFDESILDID